MLPAGATEWRQNVLVTPGTTSTKAALSVAMDANGTLRVVFEDDRDGSPAVWYATLAPMGTAWSAATKVSDETSSAPQRTPKVALDAQGNATVVWIDAVPSGSVVRARRDLAHGGWESSSRVISDAGAVPGAPTLSARSHGRVIALRERDRREGFGIRSVLNRHL